MSRQTPQDRARQLLEMEVVDRVACIESAYTLKEGIEALQWMTPGQQEEILQGMTASKRAQYKQTTLFKTAKAGTVKNTGKELLGKDVDEHIVNVVDSVNRDVGYDGLSEDQMNKEEMRRQALIERKRVMFEHHRSECALETWRKMYDGGRPSYLFFCCTSEDARVKQLEECLSVVDECERDFAADLAHFEEITEEEATYVADAGRSALSTPGDIAYQQALPALKEQAEIAQQRLQAARDDIEPQQANLKATRSWAEQVLEEHDLQISTLLKRPYGCLRTLYQRAGQQGFDIGRHVLMGPRATLANLEAEMFNLRPRVLIIAATGGKGQLLVHSDSNEEAEAQGEGDSHALGTGLPTVLEATEEEILDAFGEMTEDSEKHAVWRPLLVILCSGNSDELGRQIVYRGIPCCMCWRGELYGHALQAFFKGVIGALEADGSAAQAFTTGRHFLTESFTHGRKMREGDLQLDPASGKIVPGSPHGTPMLHTVDDKGLLRTFSHEHPNGLLGPEDEPVIVKGMKIDEFTAPATGCFGIVSPGETKDARALSHEEPLLESNPTRLPGWKSDAFSIPWQVWIKETWTAMRRAGVATRDPDPSIKDQYDAPNALYVPVTRPAPGQAVYETIGLLPGGFLRDQILKQPLDRQKGSRFDAKLPQLMAATETGRRQNIGEQANDFEWPANHERRVPAWKEEEENQPMSPMSPVSPMGSTPSRSPSPQPSPSAAVSP